MAEELIKKTILIVEDERSILGALVDKLNREGFEIFQAKDGEEGFRVANTNHPDLILLDIVLPKMDGLTMMKKLRAENAWGKNVPIILLTNLSPDEDKINRGVTETEPSFYLVKTDWNIDEVVTKVRESLKK